MTGGDKIVTADVRSALYQLGLESDMIDNIILRFMENYETTYENFLNKLQTFVNSYETLQKNERLIKQR